MFHAWHDVQTIPWHQADFLPSTIGFEVHFELAAEQSDGLIFDPVKLVAQRLALRDVEDLADVTIRVSPYKFVAPGLIDLIFAVDHLNPLNAAS